MKNEFKEALNDMQNLILDMHEKYHIEQDDMRELALQMNKIAMLAPQGTFEGDEKTGKLLFHSICHDDLTTEELYKQADFASMFFSDVGKKLFFTKEEAEAKLKELEK